MTATGAPRDLAAERADGTPSDPSGAQRAGGTADEPPTDDVPAYDPGTWARIDAAGHRVDELLAAADVRLTQGGEPTFTTADLSPTPDGQWTVAPDGDDKRRRAVALAERLRGRFAPGGVLQAGSGKWYPGEPAPRWQLTLTWRTDGEPLWPEPDLLSPPLLGTAPVDGEPAVDATRLAPLLLAAVAERLGIAPGHVLPLYEDPIAALQAAAHLPPGEPPAEDVAPWDTELSARRRRAALAAELEARTGEPVGWALPLHRTEDGERWATTTWTPRRGRLLLYPGSLPAGTRIPLVALAWRWPPGRPEPSLAAPRDPLAAPSRGLATSAETSAATDGSGGDRPPVPPAHVTPVEDAPTTSLSVQVREGAVHVHLPRLEALEHAVDLLQVLAAAAREVGVVVVLEGHAPPRDPRTTSLSVTPDPGVVEVNLHPMADWPSMVEAATGLAEDAAASGLAAWRYDAEGRIATTGGGSHITLGGPTVPDSPLLRRPDLLVSTLTYWQHHPALSYLFTGRFLGPTCQAPRVDEARHESLDELELAFERIAEVVAEHAATRGPDGAPGTPPHWVADRALRHLLVDVTGNTHRAEQCIDKLFSPRSEQGRLGLLELRAFEMATHPQTWLVQNLLVRALVARLWSAPVVAPLRRWGTELHDRFLLPSVLAADLAAVLADLRDHGIDLDDSWFAPLRDVRYPLLARAPLPALGPDAALEVRRAAEPWPVLADDSGQGAARPVDAALERVEVRLVGVSDGAADGITVTAGGRRVPLHDVGGPLAGRVGGVRFKSLQVDGGLHPTLPLHTPLTIAVHDGDGLVLAEVVRRSGTELGVVTLPVDAAEASERRAAWTAVTLGPVHGAPSGGTAACEVPDGAPPSAWTLDLRRGPAGYGAGTQPGTQPGAGHGSGGQR